MGVDFVAIDVETANADFASICQIGIAGYSNGQLAVEWKSYVDPEDFFDDINVSIHGIDERTVRGAPTIPLVASDLYQMLNGRVVVCHTHFDRVSTYQALTKHGLAPLSCQWLDSARVARRAWEQFAIAGYGLGNLCKWLGYQFTAHDALEDAKAAAMVLQAAMNHTGLGISDWLRRVEQPVLGGSGGKISRAGNPEGPLYGELIVFTGTLTIPRVQAADMAAALGCEVGAGVTKKTTLLVVGDIDLQLVKQGHKSNKYKKAEELIARGQTMRIVGETDFRRLVELREG